MGSVNHHALLTKWGHFWRFGVLWRILPCFISGRISFNRSGCVYQSAVLSNDKFEPFVTQYMNLSLTQYVKMSCCSSPVLLVNPACFQFPVGVFRIAECYFVSKRTSAAFSSCDSHICRYLPLCAPNNWLLLRNIFLENNLLNAPLNTRESWKRTNMRCDVSRLKNEIIETEEHDEIRYE